MKDTLLCKLNDVVSYLSSCDLNNDDNLRYLYSKICDIQSDILHYAVVIGFKKVNVFEEIQKELGNKK